MDEVAGLLAAEACWANAKVPTTAAIAATVAGFLAGCAAPPPKPDTMRDPSVNFSNFKTFGWTAGDAVDAGVGLVMVSSAIYPAYGPENPRDPNRPASSVKAIASPTAVAACVRLRQQA